MVMISLSTSPGCGPRFLAGWASSLSSRASQCGRNAWQKSSNWQKSSTSRSNIDASPRLMAPTQKEEFKGDKGLASPQTRNSGYPDLNHALWSQKIKPMADFIGFFRSLLGGDCLMFGGRTGDNLWRYSLFGSGASGMDFAAGGNGRCW